MNELARPPIASIVCSISSLIGWRKTLRMAMVMAVVAIFAPSPPFKLGKRSWMLRSNERMLEHGQLLELKYWQEYLTIFLIQ